MSLLTEFLIVGSISAMIALAGHYSGYLDGPLIFFVAIIAGYMISKTLRRRS